MEQEQQTPGNRLHSFIDELVPDWRPTGEQMLWMIRIVIVLVGLLGILTLIGSAFGITLWDWLKLLIIPAVIAGGTLWFNQNQQARQQEQQEHNEIVEALQGEKETVAYIAVRVREQGLPDDNKERRGQLLMALYLAMIFQHADRSRALVFSALRSSYQEEYRKEHMETLKRLIEDFTRYKNDLGAAQDTRYKNRLSAVQEKLRAKKDLGFDMGSMDKHIERLKVVEEALREQKEMGLSHEKSKSPL